MTIDETIVSVEEAYGELRAAVKVVLKDYIAVSPRDNEYRGKYCYPFFSTGNYYTERSVLPQFDRNNQLVRRGSHCFMPMPLDDDMRRFVEALRKLDYAVRPLFGWDIRKGGWPHDDKGNVNLDEAKGFCYQGHTSRKIRVGSRRKFYVLVGVICYGVYKDAFLDEILEVVRDTGKPITKPGFREIQAFSR